MQFIRVGSTVAILGVALAMVGGNDADAASRSRHSARYEAGSRATVQAVRGGMARYAVVRGGSSSYGRLQCVPFARENTGIELSGNAATWWGAADGVYARGARPEVGSILNFRATGRMRMGHVAVVSNVVNSRTIEIDHANWPGGGRSGISRNMSVVDVSEGNDWTAVRVELGRSGEMGSVYPTYGFIYDRADTGTMMANNGVVGTARSARIQLAAAPAAEVEEVAEAVDEPRGAYGARRAAGNSHRYARSARGLAFKTPLQHVAVSRATVQRVSVQRAAPAPAAGKHATAAGRRRL